MANRYIPELPEALEVQEADLLPMHQGNVTKKVSGLTMKLWLLKLAASHGGITDFQKISESGLEKTYQFTTSDSTNYTFSVTDGNGIKSFQHSVSGLVHTYTFVLDDGTRFQFQVKDGNGIADFNNSVSGLVQTCTFIMDDGTQYQFQVKDGEKGDKGDNAYVWFKFASEKPASSSSSMGDEVDDWIGFYSGNKSTAPTDPMEYVWAPFRGKVGATGEPATLTSAIIEYQAGTSGTIVPSGNWSSNVPVTTQGQYLWTRITLQFNTGNPITYYTNGYNGVNGTGAVTAVNGVNPGLDGVVWLTAADVGALPIDGGTMTGPINMNGQAITGLNDPTEGIQAARKAYVDSGDSTTLESAKTYADTQIANSGMIKSVAGKSPDDSGNVALAPGDVGAVSKTGDTMRGGLSVANSGGTVGLSLSTNDEGGNICIFPPDGNDAGVTHWELDAYNGNLRIFALKADESGYVFPITLGSNGETSLAKALPIQSGGTGATDAEAAQRALGLYDYGVDLVANSVDDWISQVQNYANTIGYGNGITSFRAGWNGVAYGAAILLNILNRDLRFLVLFQSHVDIGFRVYWRTAAGSWMQIAT